MVLYLIMRQSFNAPFFVADRSYAAPVVVFKLRKETPACENEPASDVKDEAGNGQPSSKALEKKSHRNGKKERSNTRYYVEHQYQLYLPGDWLSFNLPWGIGSLCALWYECSIILACLVFAILFQPVAGLHERWIGSGRTKREKQLEDSEAHGQK